jgi:hypothetical protein
MAGTSRTCHGQVHTRLGPVPVYAMPVRELFSDALWTRPRGATAAYRQVASASDLSRWWPDRHHSTCIRPLTLNATDCRCPVNRHLTCPYMYSRRSGPDSLRAILRKFTAPWRFVAVPSAVAAVSRGGPLRSAVPVRPERSGGSADRSRYPGPEARVCGHADRCSRTGPCRRRPGP